MSKTSLPTWRSLCRSPHPATRAAEAQSAMARPVRGGVLVTVGVGGAPVEFVLPAEVAGALADALQVASGT